MAPLKIIDVAVVSMQFHFIFIFMRFHDFVNEQSHGMLMLHTTTQICLEAVVFG